MMTLYKIYVTILAERLRKEVEEKNSATKLDRVQERNRDNVYVINYVVNRELGKGKGMIALFWDLRVAFDSVDRKVLIEAMKERDLRGSLVKRVKKVLWETKSRVRMGDDMEESFWTGRDVRQGCPMNPLLFNILIVD